MTKVIHFEFGAEDPERAIKFYENAFSWEITKYPGGPDYWLVKAGDDSEMGTNGAITPRQEGWMISNSIGVPNVDEYIKKINENGGEVTTEKMAVPKMGYMAYFKDTEGNVLSIFEPNPDAK